MRYTVTTLLIAFSFVSIGGCGQTGPLYMPPEPVQVPETVPQAQPAAPAVSPAQPTKES